MFVAGRNARRGDGLLRDGVCGLLSPRTNNTMGSAALKDEGAFVDFVCEMVHRVPLRGCFVVQRRLAHSCMPRTKDRCFGSAFYCVSVYYLLGGVCGGLTP